MCLDALITLLHDDAQGHWTEPSALRWFTHNRLQSSCPSMRTLRRCQSHRVNEAILFTTKFIAFHVIKWNKWNDGGGGEPPWKPVTSAFWHKKGPRLKSRTLAGGEYGIWKYIVIPTILDCNASLELYFQHSCLYIASVCLYRCNCPRIAGESMAGNQASAETSTTKQQIKNVTRTSMHTSIHERIRGACPASYSLALPKI